VACSEPTGDTVIIQSLCAPLLELTPTRHAYSCVDLSSVLDGVFWMASLMGTNHDGAEALGQFGHHWLNNIGHRSPTVLQGSIQEIVQ
jgi:hypothetical protein